jgi:hypothetical protein
MDQPYDGDRHHTKELCESPYFPLISGLDFTNSKTIGENGTTVRADSYSAAGCTNRGQRLHDVRAASATPGQADGSTGGA